MALRREDRPLLVNYLKIALEACDEFSSEKEMMTKLLGISPSSFSGLIDNDLFSLVNRVVVYVKTREKEIPPPPNFFFNYAGECESIYSSANESTYSADYNLTEQVLPQSETIEILKAVVRKISDIGGGGTYAIVKEVFPHISVLDCVTLKLSEEELKTVVGYWISKLDLEIEVQHG